MNLRKRNIFQFKIVAFILPGLLLFFIISCTKLSNNIIAPTITSVSPLSDSTYAPVTIIGNNLSGALAVNFGGSPAKSFHVINDTSIIAVVDTGSTGWVAVITPGGTATFAGFTFLAPFPLIDSIYSSSNQVASANLIAHWTFDSTSAEVLSNTFGTPIDSATYITGQIGSAVNFTKGGFVYAPIANLNSTTAMEQFTISMWVNIAPNDTADYPLNGGRENSLFQVNASNYNNIYGLAGLVVHSNLQYGDDTLALGSTLTQIGSNGIGFTDDTTAALNPRLYPSQCFNGANNWAFVVETYNGETQVLNLYGDSVLYLSKTMNNFSSPFLLNPSGTNQVTIGTFEFNDDGFINAPLAAPSGDITATDPIHWARGITGSLDDIRVFNTVLTQRQIVDLYLLGLQHR